MEKNKEQGALQERYDYKKSMKLSDHPLNRFLALNRYFYRPAASLIVRLVFPTKITPNQLTVTSFLLGTAASVLFIGGEYTYFVLAGILVQLSQLLDLADGMLARAKNMGSDYGAFLDLFLDRVIDFFLLSGIAVGVYRSTGSSYVLMIGMFAVSLYFLQVCLFYITNHFYGKEKTGETEEARAMLMLAVLIFSLVNRMEIFIYIIFLETIINVLVRLGHLVWIKKKFT